MDFEEQKFTVEEIVNAWRDNALQRNDEYQRGESWTVQQKQGLIDSVLRGYPIPSLFLHRKLKSSLGTVTEKYEVVDGQQRIIALADYLTDKFDLLEPSDRRLRLPLSMRSIPVEWAKRT